MALPAIVTTATSAVAQLFEVAQAIQAAEQAVDLVAEPEFEQLLTISADPESGEMSVSVTVPATVTSDGGSLVFAPTDYLP